MNIRGYLKRGFIYLKKNGFRSTVRRGLTAVSEKNPNRYRAWIRLAEKEEKTEEFEYDPLISVCMPVYDPEIRWLKEAVASVMAQTYKNWELCIADDKSSDVNVRNTLEGYDDKRIKIVWREENGHISKATNSAVEIAEGEFIALLDNDDLLSPNALYEIVKLLNRCPDADIIYSDEDKTDEKGRRYEPFFKPDYSPHTLLSLNCISHLGVYRRSVFERLGGFRSEYDGSQDYDMALRFADITDKIYHIPKILYHWRVLKTSAAFDISAKDYAYSAAKAALEDTAARRNYSARVNEVKNSSFFEMEFLPSEEDFVSIIIPVRDKPEITEACIKSVYEKTEFGNFEIIIADNGSKEEKTLRLFEKYKKKDNFTVVNTDFTFNFSRINNIAAKTAKGNILLFLNNDTEVITPDWLGRMAGAASAEDVGCVGAKLIYANDRVQHCGVILGAGGVAGHCGVGVHKNERGYFGRLALMYDYSAVTAACLAVRKSLFEKVGGFDEKLAVAFNDVDFCLRVRKTGVYNVCLPSVCLYHYESVSRGNDMAPDKIQRFMGEINYMHKKWGRLVENDPFYNINLSLDPDYLFTPDITRRYRSDM